jgi:hypothetical protein
MSAKLIKESEDGLALVDGADPSWWATGKMMQGLPTPAKVRAWWEENDPDPPKGGEHGEHVNTPPEEGAKSHTYEESGVHAPDEHDMNTGEEQVNTGEPPDEQDERVYDPFTEGINTGNGVGTHNGAGKEGTVHEFTDSEDIPLSVKYVDPGESANLDLLRQIDKLVKQGMSKKLAREEILGTGKTDAEPKVVHYKREPYEEYIGRGGGGRVRRGASGTTRSKWTMTRAPRTGPPKRLARSSSATWRARSRITRVRPLTAATS